jgi:hypothetical protein
LLSLASRLREFLYRRNFEGILRLMLAYAVRRRIPRTQAVVDVDAVWLM